MEEEAAEARDRWVKPPYFNGQLCEFARGILEEDDPATHEKLKAITRLTGLTVNVLCLFSLEGKLFLAPCADELADVNVVPDFSFTKKLLMRSVTISHEGLARALIERGPLLPEAWKESPLLRHYYVLPLDTNCKYRLGKYTVSLDGELGLVIEKI